MARGQTQVNARSSSFNRWVQTPPPQPPKPAPIDRTSPPSKTRFGNHRSSPHTDIYTGSKKFVNPQIMISQRPAKADDRQEAGHWEGDLILGLHSSAIGTPVERSTRHTMLLHLPPMPGHPKQKRIKNGPALAGHSAHAVRDAIAESITTLPRQFRREARRCLKRYIARQLYRLLQNSPQPQPAPVSARKRRNTPTSSKLGSPPKP